MNVLSAQQTVAALPAAELLDALKQAALDYAAGRVTCPPRLVTSLSGALMLSMPAAAADLAIHKLVTVAPGNAALGLPTIHGQVSAYDPVTGVLLFTLDGPAVTGRRTAGVTALGIRALHVQPRCIVMLGAGTQAAFHADLLRAVFPTTRLLVCARRPEAAQAFAAAHPGVQAVSQVPPDADVVVALTTSRVPVYTLGAQSGRLVVGVGAFTPEMVELAPSTVRASTVYVDDLASAQHEAGDLLAADLDWAKVRPLAEVLGGHAVASGPLLLKTVGCAAWDLAAGRLARAVLGA